MLIFETIQQAEMSTISQKKNLNKNNNNNKEHGMEN